ncbi:MAG TPA: enoyl-CoA hydratase/isomerase family protein [Verrucomicrobiae bacterium]|jgi:methylglutaconyl-CoA hydratase|nr:enoyl-CoA hydratase/isomerase family protein [Verrucomicrobiae bacterium]
MTAITLKIDDRQIATLTLNRPVIHNAFDDALIREVTATLRDLEKKAELRALVLASTGSSFSAGADLQWMKRMSSASMEANQRDAEELSGMLRRLQLFPRPTIAVVQGAAYGGGVGLIAACDIAIASELATFSLSEVKLGLIPSVIGPYVMVAIGERHARRYFLSAEKFTAAEALRIGLVHEVVAPDAMARTLEKITDSILLGGPKAQVAAKRLINDIAGKPIVPDMLDETARRIASIRSTDEGREGVAAFLEKRKPNWL